MSLYGHLDLVSADRIEGWVVARDDPARRRRLRILLDGVEVVEIIAGDFREDLKVPDIGVGDGCYAFSYRLRDLDPGEHVVRVMDAEAGYELHNSPTTLWVSDPAIQAAVPQSKSTTASDLNFELKMICHAGLHAEPANTVMFEGKPISLAVLSCNPYHVTAIALTESTPTAAMPVRVHINHQVIPEMPIVSDPVAVDGKVACLYRFLVPSRFPIVSEMPVQLSLAGKLLSIPWSQSRIACRFIGALDQCDNRTVSGWAACLDALDQRLDIDILVGGQIIDSTRAARYRRDLHRLGLADGDYGFFLEFPEPRESPADSDVAVRALVHGMGYELQYSPWYITRAPREMQMQELLAPTKLPD